jgi:hypothetical protein
MKWCFRMFAVQPNAPPTDRIAGVALLEDGITQGIGHGIDAGAERAEEIS